MNPLKQYKIGFLGLSIGKHSFSFDIGPDFFLPIGDPAFESGKVLLELEFIKSNNMLELNFNFSGQVQLVCDRCLDLFPFGVNLQKRLIVKFGDHYSEQSDEIVIIPVTESHFDISQYVFEYLHLGMPVRKVHEDREDQPGCDPEVIRKLAQYSTRQHGSEEDSPWSSLKNLNFNN